MKRLLALALVLVMVMSCCTISLAESTMADWGAKLKEQYAGNKITVAMASHPSTEAFQMMVEDFTKLTGIEV